MKNQEHLRIGPPLRKKLKEALGLTLKTNRVLSYKVLQYAKHNQQPTEEVADNAIKFIKNIATIRKQTYTEAARPMIDYFNSMNPEYPEK